MPSSQLHVCNTYHNILIILIMSDTGKRYLAAVRNLDTSYPLIETVRLSNRELDTFEIGMDQIQKKRPLGKITIGRKKIVRAILEQARPKLAESASSSST